MAPEAMEKLCQTGHKKEIAKKTGGLLAYI
jgi:hypothetical protein